MKAADFGRLTIVSAFLVNAGGLISLPMLMPLLADAGKMKVPFLAFQFLVGIIAAAAASLFAHFNYTFISGAESLWTEIRTREQNDSPQAAGDSELDALKSRVGDANSAIGITQMLGVAGAIASYVFFVLAALELTVLVHEGLLSNIHG